MTTRFADIILHHAYIYTADQNNSIQQAIAIKDGYIIATGNNEEIQQYAGETTQQIDLQGKMIMPGIIDSHLHPFWGGQQLANCSLEYRELTLPETLDYIQQHLDKDPLKGENDWFQVRAWLRSAMLPPGTDITRVDLDSLNSKRPIIVFANDCHTLVANSRALALFGLDESTPEPADGKLGRTADGKLNGILEDAPAMRAYDSIPSLTTKQNTVIADMVQNVLNRQGVTTVFDARLLPVQLDAFGELKKQNKLKLRYVGAKEITPDDVITPENAETTLQNVVHFAEKYTTQAMTPTPEIAVSSIKLFVDGVLQAPMMTASLLQPYRENKGSDAEPNWQLSDRYGDLYFSTDVLNAIVNETAKVGLDIHLHTVGDGAIEVMLDAVESMRKAFPDKDIRPAFAHNELVAPHQFKRFAELNVTAVLSFQWAAMAESIIHEEELLLGKERSQYLEPAGRFLDAGARVAYGSDWPIDKLDQWYNFQVGATRTGRVDKENNGFRLANDRNLSITELLRAVTINAAYVLHMDNYIGSLETGKFADLIVLDRNLFEIDKFQIEKTQVLLTVVGGKIVYQTNGD